MFDMPATNDSAGAEAPVGSRAPGPDTGPRADARLVLQGAVRAAALWCLAAVPALALLLDIQWLGNVVGEQSLVETAQLALVATAGAAFIVLARRRPDERRFALLVAGFFACIAIRETDAAWDLVADGLWQVLVAAVAVAAVAYALVDWRATLRALARFVASRAGLVMIIGLGLLMVHSRLLGMGVIWQGLLDDQYLRVFKNAVEESAELLAYTLVAAAGVVHVARRLRRHRTPAAARTQAYNDLESTC